MPPPLPVARTKLSYPLYAAEFNPSNPDFLVVGGGGGFGSSGIPNKISVIDASRRDELSEVVDVELPKGEDAISSLAVESTTATSLTAYAGINSSLAEQKLGRNEHFRAFTIDLPAKVSSDEKSEKRAEKSSLGTKAVTRLSSFSSKVTAKNEAYQRVTRLSPAGNKSVDRVVAIASAMAMVNEVIVYRHSANIRPTDEVARVKLGKGEQANDIAFAPLQEDSTEHTMVYCTMDKVFLCKIPTAATKWSGVTPIEIHETLWSSVGAELPKRSHLRSLRYLSLNHLLLVQNMPTKSGTELQILRINKEGTQGRLSFQKRLSPSMKMAVGLDVCPLSESPSGERQIIIAVAGQHSTIEVLAINYAPNVAMDSFQLYSALKDIHSGPITGLVFSPFVSPPTPITKDTKPQSVKLASVGVDQTIVVHSLPLRPYPPPPGKNPRYVLISPGRSEGLQVALSVSVAIFVIGFVAFFLQVFCEIRGAVPPTLGATNWLGPGMKEMIARPYVYGSDAPVIPVTVEVVTSVTDLPSVDPITTTANLEALVQDQASQETPKVVVIRDTGEEGELATELHHEDDAIQADTVKKWEELSEPQKKGWKKRLSAAGKWSANQGESVLKGIFFSELGGIVGGIVRGA